MPSGAGLWNPQEGSVLARTCQSTSSALEVLPGSRIYDMRDPPTPDSHAAVSHRRRLPQSCQSSPRETTQGTGVCFHVQFY